MNLSQPPRIILSVYATFQLHLHHTKDMAFQFHLPLNTTDIVNQPPLYFLRVQDALILTTGILWTVAYILYIKQANHDKSYGMPLFALFGTLLFVLFRFDPVLFGFH